MAHPNARIEAMAAAAYAVWHEPLSAPTWSNASEMVKTKFYRMVEGMLRASVNDVRVQQPAQVVAFRGAAPERTGS